MPSPRSRRLRATAVGGVAALVLTLTACGTEDSTSEPPTPTASADATPTESDGTEGVLLSGDGYSVLVPATWQESTAAVQERFSAVDAAAGDSSVSGDFADNVNVIIDRETGKRRPRKTEKVMARDLRKVGTRVQVQEEGELDGQRAFHATARLQLGRTTVRTTQYLARHDGAWYLVTFSYGPDTDAETEAEEIQQMLDTWSWD